MARLETSATLLQYQLPFCNIFYCFAMQVGFVTFNNFTLADNGAGPLSHIVNGKDNGANFEITWNVSWLA